MLIWAVAAVLLAGIAIGGGYYGYTIYRENQEAISREKEALEAKAKRQEQELADLRARQATQQQQVQELPVPPLTARVTDLTSTLSSDERAVLEQRLASFESRKGAQIAVLIVPTTQPETIDQYANRVFNTWKLGHKGVNDGVLLLFAKNDHMLRIEVGSGLEVVLNNATAKRIIDETIVPKFRSGDFFSGVSGGVAAIMGQLEGKDAASPH